MDWEIFVSYVEKSRSFLKSAIEMWLWEGRCELEVRRSGR